MIKAAVQIGIDKYPGGNQLYKCEADAKLLNGIFGGAVLLSKNCRPQMLIDNFLAVVKKAGPGDHIVVSYSGHGTQVPDKNGDEPDKLDEALVAVDLSAITDDTIYKIMTQLHPQARGWLIADSCFSGTIHRAVPMLSSSDIKKIRKKRIRYIPGSLVKSSGRITNVGPQNPLPNWVISSGCADFEFSYEGEDNGVLTGAIAKFYNTRMSFARLHQLIDKEVSGWDQHPQLTCSAAARRWKLPSK